MENEILFLTLATVFGLFMAWGIGANDVANAMATSIGSKALKIRDALIIAAIFEFAGAVLAGGEVTSTIRKGIVESRYFVTQPELLVYGMLGALLAAGTWLLIASRQGWPVSTTHSIVGAIIGFTVAAVGFDAVKWGKVGVIAASWVVSPMFSAAVAYAIYRSIAKFILDHADPLGRARQLAPIYVFMTVFLIGLITMLKGLKHVDLMGDMSTVQCYAIAAALGVVVALLGYYLISLIEVDENSNREFAFYKVEHVFSVLMVVTACSMAFAHGSNDVANAVGPVAAILSIASTGSVDQHAAMPVWVLMIGGLGIVVGLATYGRHVITMVGSRITPLTPSRGFAAGIAASCTIVFASGTGMPVSTTHAVVGAVLGVGLAHDTKGLNMGSIYRIFASWVITIPAGALLSIIFYFILKAALS